MAVTSRASGCEHRRGAGQLGHGTILTRHVALNWTEAQKRNVRNYDAGMVLEFHRAVKGIAKNETAEVLRTEDKHVIVRTENGEEWAIGAKQAKAFGVFERQSLEVAENDRLLLMANRCDSGFRAVNGELVTVRSISENGQIELQDGRKLLANYRQFKHGYAITAHRSQGKTVDAVIISADQMKKELFYVAASRGREELTVVTADKELLRDSIARSGARQSVTELERDAAQHQRNSAKGDQELRQAHSERTKERATRSAKPRPLEHELKTTETASRVLTPKRTGTQKQEIEQLQDLGHKL